MPANVSGTVADEREAAAFSATVAALADSFGDPTRRAIYLHVRAHPMCTVAQIAEQFNLHPNVARHHLDRLEAGGHLSVTKRTGSPGRPAKAYSVTDERLELGVSDRRDELLVALLEASLEMLGEQRAEQMALEVGERYGRQLASESSARDAGISVNRAMAAVASALTAHGFAARTEMREGTASVVAQSCPFGEAAAHHPVLCAVDRGIVRGMLEALGATERASVQLSSRARGDDACRTSA